VRKGGEAYGNPVWKMTSKSDSSVKWKSRIVNSKEVFMLLRRGIIILVGIVGFALGSNNYAFEEKNTDGERNTGGEKNTGAIKEPNGYEAECFATNLDRIPRTLTATIYDWTGANVTTFSSCGTLQGPGVTCRSGTTFHGRELRCRVTTNGRQDRLAGSLNTYPWLGAPTSVSLPAQD
jgi:hypothetical protein